MRLAVQSDELEIGADQITDNSDHTGWVLESGSRSELQSEAQLALASASEGRLGSGLEWRSRSQSVSELARSYVHTESALESGSGLAPMWGLA